MSKFKIIVGESSTIVREGLKNYGTFAPINDGCSRLHFVSCSYLSHKPINDGCSRLHTQGSQ